MLGSLGPLRTRLPVAFPPARAQRRAAAGLLALAACAPGLTLERLDELARASGARTVVLDDDLSLWSPLDAQETAPHLEQVRAAREDVFGLFGLEPGRPLRVWLRPDPGIRIDGVLEGDRYRFADLALEPRHGVLGAASGADEIVVSVGLPQVTQLADGRSMQGVLGASFYRRTVRHELAHVALSRLGIPGRRSWLHEGIAHLVERAIPAGEERRLVPAAAELRAAAALPEARRSLAWLFAWHQVLPPREEDVQARVAASAFVAFALERQAGATPRERLLALARASERDLIALEPDWNDWLDALDGG